MKNDDTDQLGIGQSLTQPMLQVPIETPAAVLERRLEAAGRRVALYLRHLAIPERRRHEIALAVLSQLAEDPGDNSVQAEARGMKILYELLARDNVSVYAMPGPTLQRVHMKPEEMDRRPWVHAFLRVWNPFWAMIAAISNTSFIDIVLYALLLAGLYVLGSQLP